MTPNGFSAFDQAFAAAEQKKIEDSTRKTPIYLIVGLDFGTAFTKCMVRDFNYRRATPVSFGHNGESASLIPSKLGWHAGRLVHPLDGIEDAAITLSFIKMALASAAAGTVSDWLDGVVRPLGVDDPKRQLETLQALVIFYIERILREVHDWIQVRWEDFGQVAGDTVYYNMAVPVAQAADSAVIEAFSDCLNTAVSLLRTGTHTPSNLSECRLYMAIHCNQRFPECALIPEVTANVQSYIRSRGGRHGLYLFADVGAGTVDFSVFIFYDDHGDTALTYPHAAVEHLGSSQLEFRSFHSLQTNLMEKLRLVKEGASGSGSGKWEVNLPVALDYTRNKMKGEITEVTQRVIGYTQRKVRRQQFQTMEILYGGGGCCESPYEEGIEAAFEPRWGLNPVSQPLPLPDDVDWPENNGAQLFKRFSVAYGLSFLPSDHPIQHFPDEIGEFDPAENHPQRDTPAAPSKDEV